MDVKQPQEVVPEKVANVVSWKILPRDIRFLLLNFIPKHTLPEHAEQNETAIEFIEEYLKTIPIILDDYTPVKKDNKTAINPLLYFAAYASKQSSYTEFLKRIYDTAITEISNIKKETKNSHASFGFPVGLPVNEWLDIQEGMRIDPLSLETEELELRAFRLSILSTFKKLQWAIYTFQSPKEFDRQYTLPSDCSAEIRAKLNDKLTEYAFNSTNPVMLNHLCFDPKYNEFGRMYREKDVGHIGRLLESGLLNANAALRFICDGNKGGNINSEVLDLLRKTGANPWCLLSPKALMTSENRKIIVLDLLTRHIRLTEKNKTAINMLDAIKTGQLFFKPQASLEPTLAKIYSLAEPLLSKKAPTKKSFKVFGRK